MLQNARLSEYFTQPSLAEAQKNHCIQSTWASAALQVREPGETPRKDKQSTLPVFRWTPFLGISKNISVPILKLLLKEMYLQVLYLERLGPIEIGIYERIWYACLKIVSWLGVKSGVAQFRAENVKIYRFWGKTFGKFHACTWDDNFFNREKESKDDEANTLSK